MQPNSTKDYIRIAREYLLKNIGDHIDVIEEYAEDLDDVFLFFYQSKKYLETRDEKYMLIGQGPMFIIKKDGRIIDYGSAWGHKRARIDIINKLNKERLIRIFYKDYDIWNDYYVRNISYKLIIKNLHEDDIEGFISILLKNKIHYYNIDENKNYSSHYYSKEQLEKKFEKFPVNLGNRFSNSFPDVLIELINDYPYCDFTLSEDV